MDFELIQSYFVAADKLINKRNQKIDDFMDTLSQLEKERTTLIEKCHNGYMLDLKQRSADSYERLYEKYLKVNRKYLSFTRRVFNQII